PNSRLLIFALTPILQCHCTTCQLGSRSSNTLRMQSLSCLSTSKKPDFLLNRLPCMLSQTSSQNSRKRSFNSWNSLSFERKWELMVVSGLNKNCSGLKWAQTSWLHMKHSWPRNNHRRIWSEASLQCSHRNPSLG